MIDITLKSEQKSESQKNPVTGDWTTRPMNAYEGRIMIVKQQFDPMDSTQFLEFGPFVGDMVYVLKRFRDTLKDLRSDIDEMIAEVQKQLDGNLADVDTLNVREKMTMPEIPIPEPVVDLMKMMEQAKSGIVGDDLQIMLDDGGCVDIDPSMQLKPAFNVKPGDRVRVVIVKED